MDGVFPHLTLGNKTGLNDKSIIIFNFNYLKDNLRIKHNGQSKVDI